MGQVAAHINASTRRAVGNEKIVGEIDKIMNGDVADEDCTDQQRLRKRKYGKNLRRYQRIIDEQWC